MARRNGTKDKAGERPQFRFEYMQFTAAQVDHLRKEKRNDLGALGELIHDVLDREWKLSLSVHRSTGRVVASLTDKRGRIGCKGVSYGVEHGTVEGAVIGALYAATNLLEEGDEKRIEDLGVNDW